MGRVRHVRNGGEVQVLTPAEMMFVDGIAQVTNTIYEFYGCWYHSSPSCFKKQRNVRRNFHKGQTVQEVYEATERKQQPCVKLAIQLWKNGSATLKKKRRPTLP